MIDAPSWDDPPAAEMLPMPKVHTLTPEQIDGTACPWCSKPLGDTGMKLGPRIRVADGAVRRWLPRACRKCVGVQAARVYRIHIGSCARCSHRDYCPDSRALRALALECG
ncbi:hypothetical protein G9272_31955 [Streptomyces asoensis]|uniref:Uncharacterized protein n=1 Tax=Streptomyces asoensis TaxID=249586 RepID=A0A6M4WUX9_9ACTN|nr:hypothetical protein [Streptomyces asoensis]QJT04334.1 hypothetical protein G9272_31955 [Streptomyces asoensis]